MAHPARGSEYNKDRKPIQRLYSRVGLVELSGIEPLTS